MRAVVLALVAVLAATGCVVDWTGRSGSYLLREKLDVTRERTRDLQKDLTTERERVDAIEQRAAEARRRYADSGATVQALMEDLTYVRGQLDSIQHTLQQSGQLTADMEFQLTAMGAQLGHIDAQLMERLDGYEPAPILMPPLEDEEPIEAPAPEGGLEPAVDVPFPEDAGTDGAPEDVPPAISDEERAFRTALGLTQTGEWRKAGAALQDFTKAYPESQWWLEAQFLVGRALYELGRYKAAITEYQKVIVRDDDSPWAPRAMFMQGMAFEQLGTDEDLDAAKVFYGELRRLYPKSDEASKAKVRLDALGS